MLDVIEEMGPQCAARSYWDLGTWALQNRQWRPVPPASHDTFQARFDEDAQPGSVDTCTGMENVCEERVGGPCPGITRTPSRHGPYMRKVGQSNQKYWTVRNMNRACLQCAASQDTFLAQPEVMWDRPGHMCSLLLPMTCFRLNLNRWGMGLGMRAACSFPGHLPGTA